MAKSRRGFLKGAAAGAAALAAQPVAQNVAQAQQAQPSRARAPIPSAGQVEAEKITPPARIEALTTDRPGSDFMVDVIKSLGIEYVCANPGSSFRSLQESLINHGGNSAPEFLTCCHEESSVSMAHGFAKIEGKPLLILAHGTVGLQHASMAIYNAYCDRVPVYVMLGNIMNANFRRGSAEWYHSVQDAAAMVRDFTKWDDAPISLQHFAESAVRAYKIAMTPPTEPVVIVADAELQERPIAPDARLHIPKLTVPAPPQGDSAAVAQAARMLVNAENPLIVTARGARTQHGIELLVELAETLQAPVLDQRMRVCFPTKNPLFGSGDVKRADVILGLEAQDLWGVLNEQSEHLANYAEAERLARPDAKIISISAIDLSHKSNYQDFQRYVEVDLSIAADAEATLPALIEEVKRLITPDRRRFFEDRGKKLAEVHRRARASARDQAAYAWDASPISLSRLSAELWAQIKNEDWSLVSDSAHHLSHWPLRLWDFDKHYQYIGRQGGGGVGYGAGASVGAALANRKYGRLSVAIQHDGDLNYAPAVLWTAAHHRIPLLAVMHNNRAYHQELMQVQIMAAQHNRGVDRAHIGTTLTDPDIDYSKLAQAYGVYGQGPITDPKDLAPAIKRALEVVKRGEPALIDAVTQPR
jgi:acetolactate synthase-1/2/3 large subunit